MKENLLKVFGEKLTNKVIENAKQMEEIASNKIAELNNNQAVRNNKKALQNRSYRQQLKIAQDPSIQKSRYNRVPVKIGAF